MREQLLLQYPAIRSYILNCIRLNDVDRIYEIIMALDSPTWKTQ